MTLGAEKAGESGTQVIRYQLGNHLGSASLELDRDGAVISYEEYHPYGTTAFQAGRECGGSQIEAVSVYGEGAG